MIFKSFPRCNPCLTVDSSELGSHKRCGFHFYIQDWIYYCRRIFNAKYKYIYRLILSSWPFYPHPLKTFEFFVFPILETPHPSKTFEFFVFPILQTPQPSKTFEFFVFPILQTPLPLKTFEFFVFPNPQTPLPSKTFELLSFLSHRFLTPQTNLKSLAFLSHSIFKLFLLLYFVWMSQFAK